MHLNKQKDRLRGGLWPCTTFIIWKKRSPDRWETAEASDFGMYPDEGAAHISIKLQYRKSAGFSAYAARCYAGLPLLWGRSVARPGSPGLTPQGRPGLLLEQRAAKASAEKQNVDRRRAIHGPERKANKYIGA